MEVTSAEEDALNCFFCPISIYNTVVLHKWFREQETTRLLEDKAVYFWCPYVVQIRPIPPTSKMLSIVVCLSRCKLVFQLN